MDSDVNQKLKHGPGAQLFVLIQVFAVVSGLLFTVTIQAGIVGSAHDFSGLGWANGEICVACHTPHNSNTDITAPLWNHTLSTATYQTYESVHDGPSATIFAPAPVHAPGPESLMCLSCHDGTIALDSFGGNTGGTEYISGTKLIGTDLSNDHPIGVEWLHQVVWDGSGENCGKCHGDPVIVPVVTNQMPLPFFLAEDGTARVECATCHDPHNGQNNDFLLRKSNAGSGLCLHCHDN